MVGYKKIIISAVFFVFFAIPFSITAANMGDVINFNVDKNFDASGRNQVTAKLISVNNVYIYVEKSWWESQSQLKQTSILSSLDKLSYEFNNKIYPVLTSTYGLEWRSGIDSDDKITIFFQSMNSSEGGYFREIDEYSKLQASTSNEREMVYLSLDRIEDPQLKSILAHELVHLIVFNQKNKNFKSEEDVWLNEARADFSSSILGYDDTYDGSVLQQRVKDFIEKPTDSLTEWEGTKYDYASARLFINYLVDHYGVKILTDSLKSEYAGIESINYALAKNGVKERFEDIFTDWTIASVVNDCSIGAKYCYLNNNLKNFRISPSLNFLPLTGNVSLSVTDVANKWNGNWLKFIGGNGNLNFDFSNLYGLNFKIPFIIQDSYGTYSVKFINLDGNGRGKIDISGFGSNYRSLIVIPSFQPNIYRPGDSGPIYPFTYKITMSISNSGQNDNNNQCLRLNSDLYYGKNNNDVKCLQQFLKNQGLDIYPEGLVTGYFGPMTNKAVIKFQEKYASEILNPIGLRKGTGYVGVMTREKINKILGEK